ncbi:hypothetical protein A5904_04770 [Acidithiobacillus caldus]|uniref:toprim domain-containing protein n=1 Tax=Acidithiobacillus caldus TaxID=33059 RepID=UPI0007D9349C|nr:toprim domain-containing protein [Acidithiobacillus caldus]AUW32375.1 hypothetical protein A5904_04770 [Acidithiobacillus caldus]QER45397.1 hypothetical protein F0726_02340 [Acidithiobacillus caldus]
MSLRSSNNPTCNNTPGDVLVNAGIRYKPGRWLRLKGPDLDAISVNATSGAFRDHRSGEHGGFHALCQRLGIKHDGGFVMDGGTAITDQEKDDLKAIQWAKTSWSRGIPAVTPKMPTDWRRGQEAWDQKQSEWADHREAVYDYLTSRGLDPMLFMPMIKIVSTLGNKGQDAEMMDQGADFYFMLPMYEIGKSERPEHISGIQRTYLAFGDGSYLPTRKIGRRMLGKKGVTTLPPSGAPVILPVQGQVLGSGEGFETVASFVQTTRRPGVVCWDWSGLKAWSQSLRPGDGAPTVAILVDSDKSETGQRESAAAVRRIAAHEHGKAVYLLPPETITPDAKGNRDWNDCLRQTPDQFAAGIIHSWHKSDENMALAPIADDSPAIQQKGPRDAEVAQIIAAAVERHIAFQHAEQSAKDYLPSYLDHLEKIKEWKNIPEEERKAKKLKRPKLPPLLIKVTTGVGKSHLIRELIKQFKDVPLLILTRTHELAEDYQAAGAFQYHGRAEPFIEPLNEIEYTQEDMDKNGNKFHDNTCFKYPIVKLTSENNHVPALTACRNCEFGRKFMLENYHERSMPYLDARMWFSSNGFDSDKIEQVPACLWLGHQAKASRQRVVVAPNASYSQTLATWRSLTPDGEEESIQRLVIVDEIPDLTKQMEATSADFGVHARKCLDLLQYFSEKLNKVRSEGSLESMTQGKELEEILSDLKAGHASLQKLAKALGDSVGEKVGHRLPDDLVKQIKDLNVDWLPGATARWEKAELRYGREAFVPLRVMKGIVESVSTGTASISDGKLHVQEITNLGDRIRKGLPGILLDATPSPAVEYMVKKKNGQIVSAIAKQHVRIVHFNQYLHGRTWKNKDHQQAELAALADLRDQMWAETGGASPVVLTYLPHCELAEKTEDPEWGYFGRDDVGQDNWKGRYMLLFGGPLFSPTTQALSYNSELMLRRLAGDKTSPDWSAEVERGVEVTVGNKMITSKAPLPVDPQLRQWVLDNYARRMVQGIGRARAVWATEDKPINIWIAGGLPLAGLAAHGLEVAEYREEKQNMNDESSKRTAEKVQAAMATLNAADKDTGYRAVQKELERMGLPGVRYAAWKRVQQSVYGPDIASYEGVDDLLAALGSIVKVAGWNGVDVSDAALDLWKHPKTDLVTRAAAQIILEASPNSGKWRQQQASPA